VPELPEVEVTRQGILPSLVGRRVVEVSIFFPRLRCEIPPLLPQILPGLSLSTIERRGKYLLFDFSDDSSQGAGWLLVHLGMSGSLRVQDTTTRRELHTHFELRFARKDSEAERPDKVLRLRDPRRFGLVDWIAGHEIKHPMLDKLGVEPLSDKFDGFWLYSSSRSCKTPIKNFLMDARRVVGVGNIYASESLFRAAISPLRPAHSLTRQQCDCLVDSVQQTLNESIVAGGSSLRDYVKSDGSSGYFQCSCRVYGRSGELCHVCGGEIECIRLAGRSTFYCQYCQK